MESANKIDISQSRIKNYIRDGYIKEVSYPSKNHQQIESNKCYAFTKKGKELIKDKYGIERVQNSNAREHNCKVAECICDLQKSEIDSIKTEWEIRDMWESRLDELSESERDRWQEEIDRGMLSAVDVVYTSVTGETCGIEVTTNNYGDIEIQQKEECGELLQMEIQYVPVR
ncbi:MAG: hypothetical protein ACLRZ9_02340 [Eubacterium sp.]